MVPGPAANSHAPRGRFVTALSTARRFDPLTYPRADDVPPARRIGLRARINPRRSVLFNARVPTELAEEVRYAVYLRGHDDTLSSFMTDALRAHIARYRRLYNRGEPFQPPRAGVSLKTGRPMKLPGTIRQKRPVRK